MAPPALAYLYTDLASVQRLLSTLGVTLRLADDGSGSASAGELAALDDLIAEATETCNYYLSSKYDPANLVNSTLVWRWATQLAAYALDMRRNNPPSEALALQAEKAEERLEAILEHGRLLPGVPLRMTCAPTWSNVRADVRYNWRVIRVERGTSSPSQLPRVTDFAERVQEPMEHGP